MARNSPMLFVPYTGHTPVCSLQDTQQQLDVNLKEAEALNAQADELKQQYEKELSQHKKDKKKTLKGIMLVKTSLDRKK